MLPPTISSLLLLAVPAVLREEEVGVRELYLDLMDVSEPIKPPSLINLEELPMEELLKCPIPTLTLMPAMPSLKRKD
jgi:hypothetical protein